MSRVIGTITLYEPLLLLSTLKRTVKVSETEEES